MAARRRNVLRSLMDSAARLRHDGDLELAGQVERYAREMPALDTEKRKIQRAIIAQVKERSQSHDAKSDDSNQGPELDRDGSSPAF